VKSGRPWSHGYFEELLEGIGKPFFDGLPPINGSPWRYTDRIIGEERGYGGRVIAVKVLVSLPVDVQSF
jgi:hypothetical protein